MAGGIERRHLPTDECLAYAAKTGKAFCIAKCAELQKRLAVEEWVLCDERLPGPEDFGEEDFVLATVLQVVDGKVLHWVSRAKIVYFTEWVLPTLSGDWAWLPEGPASSPGGHGQSPMQAERKGVASSTRGVCCL